MLLVCILSDSLLPPPPSLPVTSGGLTGRLRPRNGPREERQNKKKSEHFLYPCSCSFLSYFRNGVLMLYFSLQDRSSDEVSESKRRKESPDAPALTKETEAAKVRLTLYTPTVEVY